MRLHRNILGLISVSILFFLGSGVGLAQTPDGETPAVETICDTQAGAAFGLCNAYCEAMDCESSAPQASENACNRVLDKFTQITGAMPPCAMSCGNGIVEPDNGEQCDDGNTMDGDGCSSICTYEIID